jgi:DegV family protein with EDD domain
MSNVKIVTDSTAELSPEVVEEYDIRVVPLSIRLGAETYTDGPQLRSPEFYRQMIKQKTPPVVIPPTPRQFAQVYSELCRETDDIVSIHLPARFNETVLAASQGRTGLLGRCRISVINSQFTSRALGIFVTEAAKAARAGLSGPEIERLVRSLLPRTYMVFYIENLEYLKRSGIYRQPREGVFGPPSSKPLLMLEEGEIIPLQRLRNRGRPAERLLEFINEFPSLQELTILHTGIMCDDVEELKALLNEGPRKWTFNEHIYGPILGAYIGPTALGVVAFEGPRRERALPWSP